MTDFIAGLARFILRLVLLAAGLAFAAALLVAFVLLIALWSLRTAWARLTGRPVTPFVMRMDPRAGFGQVFRAGRQPMYGDSSPLRAAQEERRERREIADITDVEVKEPR